MKTRLIYLLRYTIFWMVFFILARLLFLLYHHDKSFSIPIRDWINIFYHGIKMDASMTGYLVMLASLITGIFFFSGKISGLIIKTYSALVLLGFSVIMLADMELYRHWQFRIDATPLFFLMSPREAMASLETKQLLLFISGVLVIFAGSYYCFNIFIHKIKPKKTHWLSIPLFILIAVTTIIPIRGGFGLASMNPGKVYFSHQVFYNHAALNVGWNFLHSVLKSESMNKKYPEYIQDETAKQVFENIMAENSDTINVFNNSRPNIVMIILEGFTSKVIEPLGGLNDITPGFNSLAEEGLLFTRFYASGDRSNKGLIAILSGFPAQSSQSVIKSVSKVAKLPSITKRLRAEGYHSTFYYGGDIDFSNIRAYLYQSRFQNIISQDDFPGSLKKSKWGVHDEYVFERLSADLDTTSGPFFRVLFTLSSHEPFDIPCEPGFPGNTENERFLSSIAYTDQCLADFFQKVRTKPIYDNTLFIILADHGHRLPDNTSYYEPLKFAIPMLWLGGALKTQGVIDRVGSQTDLARTLLARLNLEAEEFRFSQDLFASSSNPFTYYAFNDGFGFLTPDDLFIWDHVSQTPIQTCINDSTSIKAFSFFNIYQQYFLGL
ncbi:MAG: sulfatase-like hydrolase/transferase [Bacteroidales bacterium]